MQERFFEEATVGAHTPNPQAFGQQRQRLLQAGRHSARGPAVAAAQPAMQDEGRFGQHRQERMMTLTPPAARIVALGRAGVTLELRGARGEALPIRPQAGQQARAQ
ncbi:MAG TPA: hypothetical protein VI136_24970, partial [Verrucomicrobiae bacterium]